MQYRSGHVRWWRHAGDFAWRLEVVTASDEALVPASVRKAAIASRSLRRWPTTETPRSFRSSAVRFGSVAQSDWVFADAEHNGDRCCCRFGRLGSVVAGGRDYDSYPTVDEVRHNGRQAVKLTVQPVILHRHILTLDPAGFVEAFAKRISKTKIGLGRPEVNDGDDWHRLLLRARRVRPNCRRSG
jgi:hypothetical protein